MIAATLTLPLNATHRNYRIKKITIKNYIKLRLGQQGQLINIQATGNNEQTCYRSDPTGPDFDALLFQVFDTPDPLNHAGTSMSQCLCAAPPTDCL